MIDRRDFLRGSSAALAAAWTASRGLAAPARAVAPSDRVRLGIIGAGSRGKFMMQRFLRAPGVSFGAVCDVYPPRLEEAREVTGEATPGFADYRSMLDAHGRDLDAVVVATPLHLHAEHMIASLDAGLDVFGEKALAFTVAECDAVVAAVERTGRVFQVGHQYRYAPWYRRALDRIAAGDIGEVSHVYGYWHRNYNWRRPVPEPSLERLINWRLYREYSGGLLAELGSHHIDVANWVFGEAPSSAIGSGGIDFYRDGREVFDNVQVVFDYPSGGTLVFSSLIGNHKTGYQLVIYGTGGTVELTLEDGFLFYEPARPNSAVPRSEGRDIKARASLSTAGDMPYRGAGEPIEVPADEVGDPSLLAAEAFVAAVRGRSRPFADAQVGRASAVPVAVGNRAIRSRGRVDFAPGWQSGATSAGG
ncbi:MAG: Gfo/Idh/MocA family oxidoreductase [Thermoanaerobaculia bacterium]|nr:Gfo/Idh/MocA family oxidoreductase [Thermoanaerobaculia bacterium]